jgi:anti-sigma factor RsiW
MIAMKVFFRRTLPIFFALTLCAAARVSAQAYKVESAAVAAPAELSAAVRDALSPQALRVSGPGGVVCEIWLRKAVPGQAAAQNLGVIYTQLQEGSLVAAIRFPSDLKDYRRQNVKAGVYTFRYALSPVNGNHQGVAPQRDFLLAIPAATDQDPANVTQAQTIELSKKSTSTNHASVWCLMPGDGAAGAAPAVTHDGDADLWMAQFSISIAGTPVRMGLVVVGFGPEV